MLCHLGALLTLGWEGGGGVGKASPRAREFPEITNHFACECAFHMQTIQCGTHTLNHQLGRALLLPEAITLLSTSQGQSGPDK